MKTKATKEVENLRKRMEKLGVDTMGDLRRYEEGIEAGFTKKQLDYLFDEVRTYPTLQY